MRKYLNVSDDPNADELPFTPKTLEQLEEMTSELYHFALFEVDAAGAECMAEQHHLIALSLLQQAQRHFKLAQYAQSQGIAAAQIAAVQRKQRF